VSNAEISCRRPGRSSDVDSPSSPSCSSDAAALPGSAGVITATCTKNVVAINKNQFFESLASNLEKRLLPNDDMELVNKFKVLDPDVWPDGDDGVDMAQYGEQEIANLCAKFRLAATPVRKLPRFHRQWRQENTK